MSPEQGPWTAGSSGQTQNSQSGSLWEVYLVLLMIQSEASGRYPGKEGRLLMLSALVPNEGKSSLHCVYVFKN